MIVQVFASGYFPKKNLEQSILNQDEAAGIRTLDVVDVPQILRAQ